MSVMTIVSLADDIGLGLLDNSIAKAFPAEHEDSIKAASRHLANRIREDKVIAEDIDSFIDETLNLLPESKRSEVLAFLLTKKALLLCQVGDIENGLNLYDEALEVRETPSTWALKGTGLLQVDRIDEAFEAFQKAFELREEFGPQEQEYLNDLIFTWSASALLRGLYGILEQDVSEAQKGVEEYLIVSSKAKDEGFGASVMPPAVKESVPIDLKDAVDELELMVRLLSIKDPFEGWREFSKEISKAWPKDISAVDAIREQRE